MYTLRTEAVYRTIIQAHPEFIPSSTSQRSIGHGPENNRTDAAFSPVQSLRPEKLEYGVP